MRWLVATRLGPAAVVELAVAARLGLAVVLAPVLLLAGCPKEAAKTPTAKPDRAAQGGPAGGGTRQAGAAPADLLPQDPIKLQGLGFKTPESVLWDEATDRYLVSNINGSPRGKDGNGFISRLTPDGKLEALKWIAGGKQGVELNAPKGMAITGKTLWVADIDCVRRFHSRTGAPLGAVKLPGASFVNDVTAAKDGTIYVSDSGVGPGFKPSGTDAIWRISSEGKAEVLVKDPSMGGPNGVVVDGDFLVVATMRAKRLFRLSLKERAPRPLHSQPMPNSGLDGVVRLPTGDLAVSSWGARTIYLVSRSGTLKPLAQKLRAPADIGYDVARKRLLVPLFQDDAVLILPIKRWIQGG